jgi:serine/threonine-protein kinase
VNLVGRIVLGRYRVLRHLSDGGMGAVYLARNEGAAGFTRAVVVKTVQPALVGDPQLVEQFVREARIMSDLRHPGIVSVIDFAQEDGTLIMVLEYVHGFHLRHWHAFMKKTKRQFPVDLACFIVKQVLRALSYAHSHEVLHRDVTPNNILIDVEGHIKLADFGIARAATDQTAGGRRLVKGQFAYLAPELFDNGEPTPSSDTYAAAVTLHELLVGTNELASRDLKGTIARVLQRVPTRVDQVRAGIPTYLGDIVARALAKTPRERFESAGDFVDALANLNLASDEELSSRLIARVAADFRDPRMTSMLSLPALDELEASWKAPAAPPEMPDVTVVSTPRGGRRIVVVGAALAVAGAGVAVALTLSRRTETPAEGPAYVVVEDNRVAAPDAAAPPAASVSSAPAVVIASSAPAAVVASSAPRPVATPVRPKESTAARLTQAFGKQRGAITACFHEHAAQVSGAPEIWVRLEVGTDGAVTSASVSPESLGSTLLGKCLVDLARATRFDPQPEPVAFRVPIKARVSD